MGWTDDKDNLVSIEYEAGTVLEITGDITLYALWVLSDANEPSFIVTIPSEINFNSETATTTFDVRATLKLFPRDKSFNIKFLADDFKLKMTLENEEVDSVSYRILNNDAELSGGEKILEMYSDTALIEYNGREELTIEILDTPKYPGQYKGNITFNISIEDAA